MGPDDDGLRGATERGKPLRRDAEIEDMTDIPRDDTPIDDSRLGSRGGAVKRCVDCGDLIAVYATRCKPCSGAFRKGKSAEANRREAMSTDIAPGSDSIPNRKVM